MYILVDPSIQSDYHIDLKLAPSFSFSYSLGSFSLYSAHCCSSIAPFLWTFGFFSLWANVSQLVSHSAQGPSEKERREKDRGETLRETIWQWTRNALIPWEREKETDRDGIISIAFTFDTHSRGGTDNCRDCVCVCMGNYRAAALWLTDDRFSFSFFLFEIWKMEELLLLLLLYQVTPTLPKKVLVEICENSLFLFSFNVSVDVCDVDTRLSISKVRLMWSYSQKWNEWDSQLFVCLSTVQLLRRLVKGQKRGPRND
jgi:hypothetical protein